MGGGSVVGPRAVLRAEMRGMGRAACRCVLLKRGRVSTMAIWTVEDCVRGGRQASQPSHGSSTHRAGAGRGGAIACGGSAGVEAVAGGPPEVGARVLHGVREEASTAVRRDGGMATASTCLASSVSSGPHGASPGTRRRGTEHGSGKRQTANGRRWSCVLVLCIELQTTR